MKAKSVIMIMAVVFISGLIYCGGGRSSDRQSSKAPSDPEMVGEATGIAAIFDNDKALARDRAIDDAMNKLVKSKLGTTVEGRSVVQDFALVESIVEARSIGYGEKLERGKGTLRGGRVFRYHSGGSLSRRGW